jgi:uncharacterized phage protein (TIGR01671 family)
MRTIKFRAWDDNMMVYLPFNRFDDEYSSILFQLDSNIYDFGICGFSDVGFNYSKIPMPIIMQFTGLIDKNGKEIYEGDICNTRDGDLLTCYSYNEFIYMVLFSEEHSGVNGYAQKDLEVIGNIYENPELLINKL